MTTGIDNEKQTNKADGQMNREKAVSETVSQRFVADHRGVLSGTGRQKPKLSEKFGEKRIADPLHARRGGSTSRQRQKDHDQLKSLWQNFVGGLCGIEAKKTTKRSPASQSIWQRFVDDQRGISTVESAFLFPTLIIFMLVIFDMGRAVFTYASLNNAVAESARYASIQGHATLDEETDLEIKAFAKEQAIGVGPNEVFIEVGWSPSRHAGSTVTVTMTYSLDFITTSLLPMGPVSLTSSASMMVL